MRDAVACVVVLSALSVVSTPADAQTQEYAIKVMSPGGPAPRLPDGHPDLSGHWLPNGAGQGVSGRFGVDPAAMRQFDREYLLQDRYLYLPSIGFCLAVALGIDWLRKRAGLRAGASVADATTAPMANRAWRMGWRDRAKVRNMIACPPTSRVPPAKP